MENKDVLLRYAVENGMIDLSYVQEQIEMSKRQTVLKKYGSCIWYSESEKAWYCHIPDKTKKNGRKKVKRKNKEDIEEIVYQYFKEFDEKKRY